MEIFEIYSFFININLQSTKLILKNGKSMASIAIITHSLQSIIMFLFIISIKSLVYNMDNSFMEPYTPTFSPATILTSSSSQDTFLGLMLVYVALLFAFIFSFAAISHISSVATILISAASYTGKNISFQDFLRMMAKKWKRQWTTGFRRSRTQPERYWVLVVFLAVGLSVMYRTTLTFSISIPLAMVAAIFVMYFSVAWILAMVVLIVEEGCFGKEALEKGEELAKGHRMHGFIMNIFLNLVVLIILLGCWWIFGEKVVLDFPFLGLVMVNIISLVKMLATVEYTVLYFVSKKYHGEEIIEDFGDLQYAKLPSDNRANIVYKNTPDRPYNEPIYKDCQ